MTNTEKVSWSSFQHNNWVMHIAATAKGLCCITLPNESFETLIDWVERHIPNGILMQNRDAMYPFINQLEEYFIGHRREFELPLDFRGTPFQISVWQQLRHIPYGRTQTYSELARSINRPSGARAVGSAIGANPIPIVIPCHRVIGKDGSLTGYRGGVDVKSELLFLESSLLSRYSGTEYRN